MRILLVVSEIPPIVSGVAKCAHELVTGWQARGHTVDTVSVLDVGRRTIGEFRFTGLVAHWPRIARGLESYDVINLHGPAPSLSDAFLLLIRRHPDRQPLLYTHHSDIHLERHARASVAYNRFHQRLARVADRIVTTSHAYASRFDAAGPPVSVIPWGVDVERFWARERPPPPADADLRVLFVGQMRPYKGVEILLEAVAGRPGISVVLVGGGPLEDAYRGRAAELGARNVRFLGRVPDDQLPELYASHDVIALPSTTRAEAFGLVLLEGMAAGCVPLASDLPGVSDVAGRTGVLVRPGDVDDLRRRLERLAADRDRTWSMGKESQRAAAGMTWANVVERYEEMMLDLVAHPPARP